jgi:hypothetical protein
VPVDLPVGDRIQPEDLVYVGAFRLPDGPPEIGWGYSGAALAYSPFGDASGPDDGYPGSIFATGHNWNQFISEINIPTPVDSPSKNLEDLPVAETLQDFQNIRGNLFDHLAFEIPRSGLAILPPQAGQDAPKLHFCWHQHLGEVDTFPTQGWSELNLANPETAGAGRVGEFTNYVTCDYMFEIPQAWSDSHLAGKRLATGRYRDGGQAGMGPALFGIAPWEHGSPPEPGAMIEAVPLLLYGNFYEEAPVTMDDYHHSDEWAGGAWLTSGERSAVVFAGTKGLGECWYGCNDGTVWPDEPPYPEDCPDPGRGWWSTGFEAQLLFYDPAQFAAVASGELPTWAPQPYATLNIDPYLFSLSGNPQQLSRVGAADFDRENGLFYLFEPLADEDKSIVHVWRVGP